MDTQVSEDHFKRAVQHTAAGSARGVASPKTELPERKAV